VTKFIAYCIVAFGIAAGVTVGITRGVQDGIITGVLAWLLFGGIESAYIVYTNRIGK
jgi:hypothetical protein